jgi:hypothetical protein
MKGKYRRTESAVESCPYAKADFLSKHGRGVVGKHSLWNVMLVLALTVAGLGAVLAHPSVTVTAAQAAAGSYVISCLIDEMSGAQPCPSGNQIQAGTAELVLKAQVEDSSGHPAQRGSVIFQDCEVMNHPAPFEKCDSGSGTWSFISTMRVDTNGNAEVDYGLVSTPETIGFRFRYLGQGSGIANGVSAPMDVTWF